VREYEFVYIIQPDATPEREKEIHSRLDEAVARSEGTVLLRDDWGKRRLAYEIRKFQKGHYVVLSFLGQGAIVSELERVLRLDPDILRFLTVKVQDEVKDVEARIVRAREEEAEHTRHREERERQEAERAARLAAAAQEAAQAAKAERPEGAEPGVEKEDEDVLVGDKDDNEDQDKDEDKDQDKDEDKD
jgi:small subunit ribosomal protein S6